MLSLSKRIQDVNESQTLAFTTKARRLKEAGVNVISLTAGEPDFPTPARIKQAAVAAIASDFTHYTANQGTSDLIAAVIQKFRTENGLSFSADQILVSSGAKHSIFNALQAVCDRDDEVLMFSPYWVSYPEMVKLVGAVPVIVPSTLAGGYRPNAARLESAVTPRSKAIILNSPSNPTGVACTREELTAIARVAAKHGLYVISDEVYERVLFDGKKHVSIGSLDFVGGQVITVSGVSKAYAMTGWRIGFMGGPADVVAAAAKVQGQVTSNANSIAQKAAAAALQEPVPEVDAMVREFQHRRDIGFDFLSAIKGVDVIRPEGAMYFFFGIGSYLGRQAGGSMLAGSIDMASYLLEKYHVGTVPGVAFGDDHALRISFACSREELTEGLRRISSGLKALEAR